MRCKAPAGPAQRAAEEAAREAHRILAEQGRTRLLEALADGLVASPTEAERLA